MQTPWCSKFLNLLLWMQGGYRDLCNMGTCHPSILGFLCSFFILSAHAACFNLAMCYNAVATMHEDHKASEARPEKEAKDASTIIYVGLAAVATLSLFPDSLTFMERWQHMIFSTAQSPIRMMGVLWEYQAWCIFVTLQNLIGGLERSTRNSCGWKFFFPVIRDVPVPHDGEHCGTGNLIN